ncbi:LOW QUALITY PROTEIN: uncharacterized protein ACMZJ9_020963 [Mantella aurantiaca]
MSESVEYAKMSAADMESLCCARGIEVGRKSKADMRKDLSRWDDQQLRELGALNAESASPSVLSPGDAEMENPDRREVEHPEGPVRATAQENASSDPDVRASPRTRLEPASTGLPIGADPVMQQALQRLMDTDLTKYLQYMADCAERQAAAAERQAERDAIERERQRQHELNMAQAQQSSRSSSPGLPAVGAASPVSAKFKFSQIEKDTDIDLFLRSFEKACRQFRLSQDEWARHLTPLLRYKALDAFAELPIDQDNDYAAIKDAIIAKYQLTPEVYRKKFRSVQKKHTVASNLLTTFRQWTLGLTKNSYEALEDLMVQDQLLCICPADVQQFVLERKPESATVAAELADTFVTTRVPDTRRSVPPSWRGGQPNTPHIPPAPVSRPPQRSPAPAAVPRTEVPGRLTCHFCRRAGHLQFNCPERRSTPSAPGPPVPTPRQAQPASRTPQPGSSSSVLFAGGQEIHPMTSNHQLVTVNNQLVTGFRDTGADVTLVQAHLVPTESIIPDKYLTLTGLGGTLSHIPQARVTLDWGVGVQEKVVGLLDKLPVPVLLGTDLGKLVSYYEPDTNPSEAPDGDGLSAHTQVLCTLGQEQGGGGVSVPSSGLEVPSLEVPMLNIHPTIWDETVTVNHACESDVINANNCHSEVIPVLAVTRSRAAQHLSSEQAEGVPASSPSVGA